MSSQSNVITFYDIPSTLPGCAWSPSTWKTRYSLNFKGLAYKTIWIEFPDIEELCKEIGCLPVRKGRDGSPVYTLPAIHDPSTGVSMSDSILIAQYLDATYPDTPRLIPEGTQALQHAFVNALIGSAAQALIPLSALQNCSVLNHTSAAYYRRTRESWIGKLEDVFPTDKERWEKWKELEDWFGVVDSWFQFGQMEGPFVMGDKISFADFAAATVPLWIKKVWGEDSAEWQNLKGWHGCRWDKLLKSLEEYETIIV